MTAGAAAAAFVFLALSFLTIALYEWRAEKGSPERRRCAVRFGYSWSPTGAPGAGSIGTTSAINLIQIIM